ncbi:MAG: DUF4386 family protein [Actinomycetota bacterium]|nr:DUF4386 family protein [Actinomycetota bacterium]
MASILIKEGPANGQELQVESDLVLGRENADLTIDDIELSRQHARIKPVDGALEIEDLDSLNGTWVNGTRIPGATRLNPGDTVRIGTTVIEVLADPFPKKLEDETFVQKTVVGEPDAVGGMPKPPTPAEPLAPAEPLPPLERVQPRERRPAPEDDWLRPEPVPPHPAETYVAGMTPPAAPDVAAAAPVTSRRTGGWNLEWLAAAAAIPFAVLSVAAVILPASKTPRPSAKESQFLKFFAENQGKILIAFALITLAVLFFFPYLGLLWRTLRLAEGEPAWLSAVVFGAGISMATISVAANAFWGAAAHRAHQGLDPNLARTLFDLGAIFYMAWLPLSVFLVAGAVLIFQTGVFPRWLGWMGAIASPLVLMSAYPGGPLVKQIVEHVGLISWIIWTIGTGVVMMRRSGGPRATA